MTVLDNIINNYCNKFKIDRNLFLTSTGVKENINRFKFMLRNSNLTQFRYVVKHFTKYDIVLIWIRDSESCNVYSVSKRSVDEALRNKQNFVIKAKYYVGNENTKVYLCNISELENLLEEVIKI